MSFQRQKYELCERFPSPLACGALDRLVHVVFDHVGVLGVGKESGLISEVDVV